MSDVNLRRRTLNEDQRAISSARLAELSKGRHTEPRLTPAFYVDAAWLDPAEYEQHAAGTTCGLCLRMWSDYCVRHGMTMRPFAAALSSESSE